ncbi:MAG: CAP domain-containing protein [Mucilaginibacter sp.]
MKKLTGLLALMAILLMGISATGPISPRDNFKKEFLARINGARHKGCNCGDLYMPPAPPLTWNDDLEKAAIGHAQDMYYKNYFSHTSKDGRTTSHRVINAGYKFKGYKAFYVGENIALGQMSIDEVMDGWLKSPGHCKNLMNAGFKEVGVAQFNQYWVQDFGGREPFSAYEQKMIKSGRYKIIRGKAQNGD